MRNILEEKMKKGMMKVVLAFYILFCCALAGAAQQPLPLIPFPAEVEFAAGAFRLDEKTSLVVSPADSAELKTIAGILQDKVRTGVGISVPMSEAGMKAGKSISLELVSDPELALHGGESYRLKVSADGIRISAVQAHGLFNGTMTALQLLEAGKGEVPCLSIFDYPRFSHRGILIDPARNFLSVAMVKQVIDKMSQLKMNVLHFHLVDDQGWRFESKIFPKLQQIGGATGYYTQDQLRDLVAYGQARYVTIMPEIEMPGHSRAMLAAYPELTCSGEKVEVAAHRGIFTTTLCPGKPEVYEFLDKLLKEVAGIFPSYYIHTGSDEVAARDWESFAPNRELGENLRQKGNKGLQCYFINRVNQTFLGMGRRMTVWDEMVDCLPEGSRVQAWRSIKAAETAVDAGHEVVVSLINPWYLDYPEWLWKLKKVYKFDPVPAGLGAEKHKLIAGGEGCLWGESAPEETIMPKLFPRIMAIAEVLWSPEESRDWRSFKCRKKSVQKIFEDQGVKFFLYFPLGPF